MTAISSEPPTQWPTDAERDARRAIICHAEDLGFHQPDVALVFISPASVLDENGHASRSLEAVKALRDAHPWMAAPPPRRPSADAHIQGEGPTGKTATHPLNQRIRNAADEQAWQQGY